MNMFQFFMPVKVEFGCGSLNKLPTMLKQLGIQHPYIISDSVILRQPFAVELVNSLPHATIYSGVIPNPTIASVDECGEFCRQSGCDGLVALGGGSAMDTAKAVSAVALSGISVRSYLDGQGDGRQELPERLLPLVAVPTTFGTGSEVSQYAVITDQNSLRKDSISNTRLYPSLAVVDPQVSYGLPTALTVATGLDVLGHALEAITSTIENQMTDILAVEALKKVFANLPQAVKNDKVARGEMALASILAGIAMSHCCGTLPHGMGCPLSGHCQVPHGLAVGVLQVPTLRLLAKTCPDKLDRVAVEVDPSITAGSGGDYLIARIEQLFADIGRKANLAEYGLTAEKIAAMTGDALLHGCTGLMPQKVDEETICKIYKEIS